MTDAVLAPEWVAWLAENALRGASRAALVAGLVAGGVDPDRAGEETDRVLGSPILAGARALVGRSAGVEQAARLRRTLDDDPVRELTVLDEATFHREFWTANRPVILRGAASTWPAAGWTPSSLAERFGDAEVDVLVGRASRPRWWRDRDVLVRRMLLRELVAACIHSRGDDLYADGRTRLLEVPALAPLKAELGVLPGLAGGGFPTAWIGPSGTVTPLHHDQSSGWFVQLFGRKRVWMASPLEAALMSTAVGVYNDVDPREPQEGELAEVRWHTFELEPGDAALFPVGWWHQVVALGPSISVSFAGFRWPNGFEWYCPGRGQRDAVAGTGRTDGQKDQA